MERKAVLMLLLATFFWGWTFPVIKDAISVLPVFAFLTWRFGLAAIFMLPTISLPDRKHQKSGIMLGCLLFLLYGFQTVGLQYTSASNCAFITGLSLVFVAIFRPSKKIILPVVAAVLGFWLLVTPDKAMNIGDLLTVIGAFFIAVHMLILDKLDDSYNSRQLATIQFSVVAILCFATSVAFESSLFPNEWSFSLIFSILLSVFGATIFALWAQTHYQRHTTAVKTALIFTMEPVFAAAISFSAYEIDLTLSAGLGASIILLAMIGVITSGESNKIFKS